MRPGKILKSRTKPLDKERKPLRVVIKNYESNAVVRVKMGVSTVPLDVVYGKRTSQIVCRREVAVEISELLTQLIKDGEFEEAVEYVFARRGMMVAMKTLRDELGAEVRMDDAKRILRALK